MRYLKTSTELEAVRALEFVAQQAARARRDEYAWKWIFIGLHNALQSFMVLALAHGSGLSVLKSKIAKQWLAAYRAGGPYPEEKLDPFLGLFEKVQGDAMRRFFGGEPLAPSVSQRRSVEKLNSIRNKFVHFLPGHWNVELTGAAVIAGDCLAVAEFLSWESRSIIWIEVPQTRVRRAFRRARRSLGVGDAA